MKSIWESIDLSDYENHMSMPGIAQAQYLSAYFEKVVSKENPSSIILLGCAGGNGLERLSGKSDKRIICMDINSNFLKAAEDRYKDTFENIEFIHADISSSKLEVEKSDLVFAALIFEYINIELSLINIANMLNVKGQLAVVLQKPNEKLPEVSPSQYKSLEVLSSIFNFIPSVKIIEECRKHGLMVVSENESELASGKRFTELVFEKKIETAY